MAAELDILIPTYRRPSSLAITLTSLLSQTFRDFRVFISDQTEGSEIRNVGEVAAIVRILHAHGLPIELHHHIPHRGMAEQRQFLLDQATAPYSLFLDDDLVLEPDLICRLMQAIRDEGCGFVGSAPIGLSFINDARPSEQAIEFWEGPVTPEIVRPGTPQWGRYKLHNAANIHHVQQRLKISGKEQRKYKVAWVGGCVLCDTHALKDVGGFNFWHEAPMDHCGEDVLVSSA